jgi:hypothetical protein
VEFRAAVRVGSARTAMTTLDVPAREPVLVRRVAPPAAATWAVLWIVAITGEVLSLRPVLLERDTPIQGYEIVLALVGASFTFCGLIAWRRRPDSRSGLLMTVTGFAFYVRPLLSQIPGELSVTLFRWGPYLTRRRASTAADHEFVSRLTIWARGAHIMCARRVQVAADEHEVARAYVDRPARRSTVDRSDPSRASPAI